MGSTPVVHQHHLLLLSLFLLAHFFPASLASAQHPSPPPAEAPAQKPASSFVLASCADARYPSLCVRTLSSSQLPPSSTPADLAIAAVSASLACARDAAGFLSRLLPASDSGPLDDCRELLADAADLLEATEAELRRLRRKTSRRQLEDALTWASAAMTDQDTCVEGIQEGGADEGKGAAVVERVSCVSQYNSNALHLISRLKSSARRL